MEVGRLIWTHLPGGWNLSVPATISLCMGLEGVTTVPYDLFSDYCVTLLLSHCFQALPASLSILGRDGPYSGRHISWTPHIWSGPRLCASCSCYSLGGAESCPHRSSLQAVQEAVWWEAGGLVSTFAVILFTRLCILCWEERLGDLTAVLCSGAF
jgi:hypothetical protein